MLTESPPGAQVDRRRGRWICVDVGETLVDETRVWTLWADALGVPALTLMAALGGAISRGGDYREAFELLGLRDWAASAGEVEARYGGFRSEDLYPDALPALSALSDAGYRVAVVANQPASRHGQLAALGVKPEVMAMSQAMGVAKPEPAFFAAMLRLLGDPDPADVAYVGDRADNDIAPAAAAGLRAVRIRRGPWGWLQEDSDGLAALTVTSLAELAERLDEIW